MQMRKMKWARGVMLGAVSTLLLAGMMAKPAQAASVSWRTSLSSALKEAKKAGRPVFVDFTATWCGPCQDMKKKTFKSSKVVNELKKWVSVSVDIDKQENVAKKYNITAVPTLIIMKPNGKAVSTKLGFQDADDFLKWLKANYSKARK